MGRRLLVVFLAVCLGLPTLALAADTDPQKRFIAADQAKARSFLIKRGDLLAGWTRDTDPPSDDDDFTCAGYDPNLSDLTLTGEAEAKFAHKAGAFIGSYSSVFESATDAKASWARVVTPAITRCLAQAMRETVAEDDLTAKVTSSVRVPFPRVAERVVAFRMTFSVKFPKLTKPVPFTLDMIGLGNGRADVLVMAMAPYKGFAPSDLRAMAATLSQRMTAAKV